MAWTLLLPQWFWDNLLPWIDQRLRLIGSWRFGIRLWIEGLVTRVLGPRKSVPVVSWSWGRTVGGALGCFALLHLVLLWNLNGDTGYRKMYKNPSVRYVKYWPCYLSRRYNLLVRALRLDQTWSMFAPNPRMNDGWFVIEGETMAGTNVNVLQDSKEVEWSKPERVVQSFSSRRWRRYQCNLLRQDCSKHLLYYGKYLTRKWNRDHPAKDGLKGFRIYYMKETTLPDGQEATPEPCLIWAHDCIEDDFDKGFVNNEPKS